MACGIEGLRGGLSVAQPREAGNPRGTEGRRRAENHPRRTGPADADRL